MKFSSTFLLAVSFASASAITIRSSAVKSSLLSKSRRLEQEEEGAYLAGYKLKLIGCAKGAVYVNPETGVKEHSSVIYRLCPEDDCSDDSTHGCKSGYGDFVVGINSFVYSWLEEKKENMQQDDNFKIDELSECQEYEAAENDGEEQQVYYVGPTCGDDATEIKLGFFSDYECTVAPEDVTFSDISNGWTLPYSSTGLVTNACDACAGYNDNGEYELSEMCTQLYEWSGKCESKMETVGYAGPDESSCEKINTLMPKMGISWTVVGWTVLAFVLVGAGFGYTKWWLNKKRGSNASDDASTSSRSRWWRRNKSSTSSRLIT